jgi:pimeloyl-ACP methyl ester carboxylesterase
LPFPASQLCTIPAAGHMIHFDAPQRLATEIEQFFTKPL